jgi:hypothetical protein
VYVVALTVQLHQHRRKVAADLGEDMPETLNSLAVEEAATVFGHEDQMDVHWEYSDRGRSWSVTMLRFNHELSEKCRRFPRVEAKSVREVECK